MKENEHEENYEQNVSSPLHPRMIALRKLYFLIFTNTFCVISIASLLIFGLNLSVFQNYWMFLVSFILLFGTVFCIYSKKRYLVSPSRNFSLMILFNLESLCLLFVLLDFDHSNFLLMIFIECDAILLFLAGYSFISQNVFTFEIATLTILAPIFFVFNIFLLFSEISLEYLIFGTMISIIWGFYLVYETQSIMKFSRSGIEKSYIFIESITIHFDLLVLSLRNSELLFDVLITKKSGKFDKMITNMEEGS